MKKEKRDFSSAVEIGFHDVGNKFNKKILPQTALVIPGRCKGYVTERKPPGTKAVNPFGVSSKICSILQQLEGLSEEYAAVAAFYQRNPSNFVVDYVINTHGDKTVITE